MRRFTSILLILLIPVLTGCEDEFKDTCVNELHGVVKSDTKVITTTAFDSKGKMITGTSTVTVRFCVVDGEIKMQS